jgi:DNA-binding transcriptional LysR family regulator
MSNGYFGVAAGGHVVKFHQLKALETIARAGSLQEAARVMRLTQPALSKSIRELERQLGAPMLVRHARGVALTAFGRIAVRRALAVRRELEKLEEEIASLRAEIGGKLAVGFTSLAGVTLAEQVASFVERHPSVELKLVELRPGEILSGLRQGSLDLGLVTLYGDAALQGLDVAPVASYETTLMAGGRRDKRRLSVAELMAEQWVDTDSGEPEQGYISTLARQLGVAPPARTLKCPSMNVSVQLASKLGAVCYMVSGGIAFFRPEIEAGALTPLEIDFALPSMKVVVAYPDEDLLSPAARELTRLLRSPAMGGATSVRSRIAS